jgi:hypothetical protein
VATQPDYELLEREHEWPAKHIADHRAALEQLPPIADVNGVSAERIALFCAGKHISLDALAALNTRVNVDRNGGVELVFGYPARVNGSEIVSALKFRPLGDKPRYAREPSVFVQPLVIGDRSSLDWFVAEGETDGARLYDLVGDVAAVLVLPAGARAFKREWADRIPRGATVHLALDADEHGDAGAEKVARLIGGRTVRVRPPGGVKDWCEWDGSRDEFVRIVAEARAAGREYEFGDLDDFLEHPFPKAEPLLGEPGQIYLAVGSLLLVYGADGSAKSTWTIDGIAHLAAGRDWLGLPVPRPVRFCIIENEGPPSLFQAKLEEKIATWDGDPWRHNVFIYRGPWGEFSFADADARSALTDFCDEHEIDVVAANPTLGLGAAASGRPDETQQFVDWLVACGLKTTRAFWLLHHENKSGAISGDWGRHPDAKVQLQADGNRPRTKLIWEKTRWATLPSDEQPKACILEWITDTKGYTVVETDSVGASDSELEQRIADFLTEHPWSSTRAVWDGVSGTNERIRKLLDGDRFDCVGGPRNSILWGLANDCVGEPDAVTESQDRIPHE